MLTIFPKVRQSFNPLRPRPPATRQRSRQAGKAGATGCGKPYDGAYGVSILSDPARLSHNKDRGGQERPELLKPVWVQGKNQASFNPLRPRKVGAT